MGSERPRSPPPSYNSLYPHDNSRSSTLNRPHSTTREDVAYSGFIGEAMWRGESQQQFGIKDNNSLKKMRKNQRQVKRLSKHSKLEAIVVHGDFDSGIFDEHAPNSSLPLSSYQKWKTTFVSDDSFKSTVEYAVLPSIQPHEVHNVVRAHEQRFNCDYGFFQVYDINIFYFYKCKLGTLYEKRSIKTHHRTLKGAKDCGSNRNESFISAWDVDIPIPDDRTPRTVVVPNTERVEPCIKCEGCDHVFTSTHKHSTKRMNPVGYSTICTCCKGAGKVLAHHQVTAEWSTRVDSYNGPIMDCKTCKPPRVSEEFWQQCEGITIYEEKLPSGKVVPITRKDVLDHDIIAASNELIEKHLVLSEDEKIVKQRQCVYAIPIYQVMCDGNEIFDLWIFGTNHLLWDPYIHNI